MIEHTTGSRQDFFISYHCADRLWAEWIAWQLEEAGYKTELPERNPQPNLDMIYDNRIAPSVAKQTIIILSPDYLNVRFTQNEWNKEFENTSPQRVFVPIQVRECNPPFKARHPDMEVINLIGKDEETARRSLVEGVRQKRATAHLLTEFLLPPIKDIPGRNLFFTDRKAILQNLREAFSPHTDVLSAQPLALCGLAGIGKTQIAIEYAHRFGGDYQCIFWVQADSRENLERGFMRIAELLALPQNDLPTSDQMIATVKEWLQEHEQWLLIFDDANDLKSLQSFISVGFRGDILLTTNAQALGTIAQRIEVDKLERDAGALFLLHRAKLLSPEASFDDAPAETRRSAGKVVDMVNGLPLALDQAGAYIEETQCGLEGYLDRYHQQRNHLSRQGDSLLAKHINTVATTWKLSMQHLRPATAELLTFCAFLSHDAIPEEIITHSDSDLGSMLEEICTNPFELDAAIEEVRRFSLISRDASTKTLNMHPLVQVTIIENLPEFAQKNWAERAVRAVYRVFPEAKTPLAPVLERCERYIVQALTCADLVEYYHIVSSEAAHLLHEAGAYLFHRMHYSQAQRFYRLALDLREEALGKEHPDVATSLNDLAWLYRYSSNYDQAKPLYQRALAIQEQRASTALIDAPNREHSDLATALNDLATTLNDLAWLYYNQGMYDEAEPLYQRALNLRQQMLPDDHPDVATSLNNLAWLYFKKGKYHEAEPLFNQALYIQQDGRYKLEPDHPYIATSIKNLATLYYEQAKDIDAEPLYLEARTIFERTLGPEHPDVATTLCGLAQLYYIQGRYEQAEAHYKEALRILQNTLPSDHPHIAETFNDLARLYRVQADYPQSEKYYTQALELRKQKLGPNHPDVAQTLHNMARLYRSQGQYEKSEEYYQRARSIREKVLGRDHPDFAETLNDLGRLYRILGKYGDAEKLHRDALSIREKVLGPNHPSIAQTLKNLAQLYLIQGAYESAELYCQQALALWTSNGESNHYYKAVILNNAGEIAAAQQRYKQAESLYQQALEIHEKTIGVNHPYVALILNNLAEVCCSEQRYSEAEAYLSRAIQIREKTLNPEHPHIAFSLMLLAKIHMFRENYSGAEENIVHAIAIRSRTLGTAHPDTATSIMLLADLYTKQGKYEQARTLYQQVLTIREVALDPRHPDIAKTIGSYLALLEKMDRPAEVEQLRQHAQTFSGINMQQPPTKNGDTIAESRDE